MAGRVSVSESQEQSSRGRLGQAQKRRPHQVAAARRKVRYLRARAMADSSKTAAAAARRHDRAGFGVTGGDSKAKEMNGKAKVKVYRSQLMTMSLLRKKRQIEAARC
jgi:hypothetical protein